MTSNRYGPVTKPKSSGQLQSGRNSGPWPTWSTISGNIWLPFISNGLGHSFQCRAIQSVAMMDAYMRFRAVPCKTAKIRLKSRWLLEGL
jgi:hypothetical protein